MRKGCANPDSDEYYNLEVFFNNIKLVNICDGREKALAVCIVDKHGKPVDFEKLLGKN